MTNMKVFNKLRRKYIHRYDNQVCPFCDEKVIATQEVKGMSGNLWRVLVNQYPILDGNLMLVVKRHIEDINELTDAEWVELSKLMLVAQSRLSDVFHATSFNIGINIGKSSGSSVRHLHWHIIPRNDDQSATGFASEIAGIQTLRISVESLREQLDGGK